MWHISPPHLILLDLITVTIFEGKVRMMHFEILMLLIIRLLLIFGKLILRVIKLQFRNILN
jgi:hypothetical protein